MRFHTLLAGNGQANGAVYECISVHEALGKTADYWNRESVHGVADTVIVRDDDDNEVLRMSVSQLLAEYPPISYWPPVETDPLMAYLAADMEA